MRGSQTMLAMRSEYVCGRTDQDVVWCGCVTGVGQTGHRRADTVMAADRSRTEEKATERCHRRPPGPSSPLPGPERRTTPPRELDLGDDPRSTVADGVSLNRIFVGPGGRSPNTITAVLSLMGLGRADSGLDHLSSLNRWRWVRSDRNGTGLRHSKLCPAGPSVQSSSFPQSRAHRSPGPGAEGA